MTEPEIYDGDIHPNEWIVCPHCGSDRAFCDSTEYRNVVVGCPDCGQQESSGESVTYWNSELPPSDYKRTE